MRAAIKIIVPSFVLLILLIFFIKTQLVKPGKSYAIRYSGEFELLDNLIAKWKSNGQTIFEKRATSNSLARSGSKSFLLNEQHRFGMNISIKNVNGGERYLVSAWRPKAYQTVSLVAQGDWDYWKQESEHDSATSDGWQLVKLDVAIPTEVKNGQLKIYGWLPSGNEAYFDDLRIVKISAVSTIESAANFPKINLEINDRNWSKIVEKRNEAISKGLLIKTDDDWVDGSIIFEGDPTPKRCKLRLKGDWTDHLKGDKWSFRIKFKNGDSWNGIRTFSIQAPDSRHNISEWILHALMKQEDVLTPRFDFMHVSLNGNAAGVYAYEEHFEKQLLESNNRQEGPIVKFGEEGLWKVREFQNKNGFNLEGKIPLYESSPIETFQEQSILDNPQMKENYFRAQELMHNYKFGLLPAQEIFNLSAMARFFAICDLTKSYHSLIWHNLRFYYNPITAKLEPIAFDGYTEEGPFDWIRRPYLGFGLADPQNSDRDMNLLIKHLFASPEFYELYDKYLETYSQRSFVRTFLKENEDAISAAEWFIRQDDRDYAYDRSFLQKNAKIIRNLIYPKDASIVHAYIEQGTGRKQMLTVVNYHNLPVKVMNLGQDRLSKNEEQPTEKTLPAYQPGSIAQPIRIELSTASQELQYQVVGLDSVFSTIVLQRPFPGKHDLNKSKGTSQLLIRPQLYEVENTTIIFKTGKHVVQSDVVIPSGFSVEMSGGTTLDFIDGSGFISHSPIYFGGSEERIIRFFSSDSSAGGLTVLNAQGKSRLSYVVFEGFNARSHAGQRLTGAVTFYESDVEIYNSSFIQNQCEDALNLIRSNFELHELFFNRIAGDAINVEFCTGSVSKSRFSNIKRDAIDVSGSNIKIDKVEISSTRGIGMNVREKSVVSVKNTIVRDATIGVASTGQSEVHIQGLSISSTEVGFYVYQNEKEVGSSLISAEDVTLKEVNKTHQVQPGSLLKLNGESIEGSDKFEVMY